MNQTILSNISRKWPTVALVRTSGHDAPILQLELKQKSHPRLNNTNHQRSNDHFHFAFWKRM